MNATQPIPVHTSVKTSLAATIAGVLQATNLIWIRGHAMSQTVCILLVLNLIKLILKNLNDHHANYFKFKESVDKYQFYINFSLEIFSGSSCFSCVFF